MKIKILIIALFAIFGLTAQEQVPVGAWRTYLSYVQGTSVAVAGDVVYCIADGSFFSYRTTDQSLNTYSKIDGLNDIIMSKVRYDKETGYLLMGYENGNIDLLLGNSITNIPDIKLKTISGNKSINNLRFKDGFAYLAFDFGIVVVNLDRGEIKETYKLNFNGDNNPVNDLEFMGDTIFAATEKGVYYGLLTDNLIDQRNWSNFSEAPFSTKPYYNLVYTGTYLVGAQSDNILSTFHVYVLNGLNGKKIADRYRLKRLIAKNGGFVDFSDNMISEFNADFSYRRIIRNYLMPDGTPSDLTELKLNDGDILDDDTYVTADYVSGLIKHVHEVQSSVLTPKGPEQNIIRNISYVNGKLRLIHGGEKGWNNTFTKGSVSILDEGKWENLNWNNTPALVNLNDFMDLAVDPDDSEHFFVTSFGNGVIEFQGNQVLKVYDESNSSIQNILPGRPYARTVGIDFDNDHNLWVTNSWVANPISCLKNDGTWVGLRYPEISNSASPAIYDINSLLVADDGNKWVLIPRGVGLFVIDDMGTIDDVNDDKTNLMQVIDAEGEIVSNYVNCIAQDKDGTIWVGTNNGPVLYYNVEKVLDDPNKDYPCYRIKIPRNDGTDRADYLLDGETVTTIAIDGGNRKWVGTANSGLFLFSPDGLQTVQHFTTTNSPILSNTIVDVELDDESGEVFIATNKGLITFRSDATSGNASYDKLAVFPNPVREDYTGDIIVTGLIAETTVKITDISGNLVYETTSNGGTASWSGNNFYGQKVGTGIYLIFCADKTGENSAMTKLLIIN